MFHNANPLSPTCHLKMLLPKGEVDLRTGRCFTGLLDIPRCGLEIWLADGRKLLFYIRKETYIRATEIHSHVRPHVPFKTS